MENLVLFRPNQHVTTDDLNNIELYARQSFDDIVSDAIEPGIKYAGFQVTQNGPTGALVNTGRLYSGGQVFVATSQTTLSF